MPRFSFEAVNGKGEKVKGQIDAADREAAKAEVQREGLFAYKIQGADGGHLDPDQVARAAVLQGTALSVGLWLIAIAVPVFLFVLASRANWDEGAVVVSTLLASLLGLAVAGFGSASIMAGYRFRAARDLRALGHHEQAVRLLKAYSRVPTSGTLLSGRADTALYEIALTYDAAGQSKLAVAAYSDYLKRSPAGAWVMEATVRLEELDPTALQVHLEASPKAELRCPYCRDGFVETPWECGECHTPHHESCYTESGGCATYGCGRAAERKVEQ